MSDPTNQRDDDQADDEPLCDVWIIQPDGSVRPMAYQAPATPNWTPEEIAAGLHLDDAEE